MYAFGWHQRFIFSFHRFQFIYTLNNVFVFCCCFFFFFITSPLVNFCVSMNTYSLPSYFKSQCNTRYTYDGWAGFWNKRHDAHLQVYKTAIIIFDWTWNCTSWLKNFFFFFFFLFLHTILIFVYITINLDFFVLF